MRKKCSNLTFDQSDSTYKIGLSFHEKKNYNKNCTFVTFSYINRKPIFFLDYLFRCGCNKIYPCWKWVFEHLSSKQTDDYQTSWLLNSSFFCFMKLAVYRFGLYANKTADPCINLRSILRVNHRRFRNIWVWCLKIGWLVLWI